MAQRKFVAQLRPCNCCLQSDIDKLQTKPGLALTPTAIKELTDKGIAVSLPNAQNFIQPEANSSWFVDPIFRRDATMVDLWEKEQTAKAKVIGAYKKDKQKYGD